MSTKRTLIGNIKGKPGDTPYITEDGNWGISGLDTGVKAQGLDGKSAYQYAVDGGYTGTEEEFAEKLNKTAMDAYTKAEADAKFLTTEADPTVPSWAKAATKPTYTAAEVGAESTGAVSAHNTDTAAHSDLRLELQTLANRVNAALDSDDETLDELSEIVAYIKSNKTLIDAITTSKVSVADIVNDLVTNVANRPLSAAQGVALKALIDTLTTTVNGKADATDLTAHINNKSNPHGVTAAQVGAVPTSRTVNGKALSANITLNAGDVNAAPAYTYGTADLEAGSSALETGKLYFVYE